MLIYYKPTKVQAESAGFTDYLQAVQNIFILLGANPIILHFDL